MNIGCRPCKHFKQQKGNKHMGHCCYPLPNAAAEAIGNTAMKKGIYIWEGNSRDCPTFSPREEVRNET